MHPSSASSCSKVSWSVSCGKWSWSWSRSSRNVTSGESVSAESADGFVGSNVNAANASGGKRFVPVFAAMEKGEFDEEG